MTAFRRALEGLAAYEPGPPIELLRRRLGLTGPIVKLDANEGSFGPVPAAVEVIRRAADEANRYPDGGCWALRDALALRHGLAFEQVVVGPGVDAVLTYLALALLEPGDEVAFCWPTFPVYLSDAMKLGATPVKAPLADGAFDLEALADAVTGRTKLVFVTNPNNPTGGMVTRDQLAAFLDRLPDTVLPVVDEAYFEYVDEPDYPDALVEHLRAGRRVVVLRTFSKIYGLAGLRVGWAAGPADVVAACIKVKNAFDVSQVAQDAALASLDADDEIARRRGLVASGRERLAAGLRALGLEPLPSVANFVWAPVPDAAAVAVALEQHAVLVRCTAGFGAPEGIRVTVGTDDEIDVFLAACADVAGASR